MRRVVGAGSLLLLAAACGPPPEEASQLANGSFTVELNGFPIHYEVHGRGPVLMTLPNSWGLTLGGLRALYRPLEEQRTLVYFDPRGVGGSAPVRVDEDMSMASVRSDFDALRAHLGLDRVAAIGWSNGASNLMLLAAEHPETISHAVFVHGIAYVSPEDYAGLAERYPELFSRFAEVQRELAESDLPLEEKTARIAAMFLDEYFPQTFADPASAAERLSGFRRDATFSWQHQVFAGSEGSSFDARESLVAIRARGLVLAGRHDMMPPERVREVHEALPDSSFVIFENSGHFAPLEEPEAFARTVLEFLGEDPQPAENG